MLLQLFRACSSSKEAVFDKWMLPLDLCSLATHLRKTCPNIETEIIDGQVVDRELLYVKINPAASIVGITYTVFSVDSMEQIAKTAKRNGSFVVVGGHAATAAAENLLSNPNIDAVIKYDGEVPLTLLAKKIMQSTHTKYFGDIPNLLFRTDTGIGYGPSTTFNVNSMPTLVREIGGVNIENYIQAYSATCTEKRLIASRPTNAYSKKGCPRSCSFCGRVDKTFRPRSAESVYREYAELSSKYKVDYIYDHSDTWIDAKWMSEFEEMYHKNGPLDLRYMIFGDVRDINRNVTKQLNEFGVDIVLLGLESGSEQLLQKNGKNLTRRDMKSCVSMLADENIKVSASFVLGMIGETNDTIDETVSFISDINKLGDVTIYCNLIIPLPGSWQWKLMMNDPQLCTMYQHKYNFNIEELREQYINKFTHIQGGLRYLREIRDIVLRENGMPILEYAR